MFKLRCSKQTCPTETKDETNASCYLKAVSEISCDVVCTSSASVSFRNFHWSSPRYTSKKQLSLNPAACWIWIYPIYAHSSSFLTATEMIIMIIMMIGGGNYNCNYNRSPRLRLITTSNSSNYDFEKQSLWTINGLLPREAEFEEKTKQLMNVCRQRPNLKRKPYYKIVIWVFLVSKLWFQYVLRKQSKINFLLAKLICFACLTRCR